jgi:hypothetical protein
MTRSDIRDSHVSLCRGFVEIGVTGQQSDRQHHVQCRWQPVRTVVITLDTRRQCGNMR